MLNNKEGGSRWHGTSSTANSHINTSIELARALSYISADIPRDDWVKIAAAWKSADGDFDTWDEWSSKGQSYNSKDTLSVWNSLSADGGIGSGTLYFYARQFGYELSSGARNDERDRIELDKAGQPDAQRKAQKRAEGILNQCSYATDKHPYLEAKHIKPILMPWIDRHNRLVLPVMNISGDLFSLQFIDESGQKQFLAGGQVKGNFYQIWSGKRAIVVCEGYATGVTLYRHYTPDCSVVVAFNSGNLKPVAMVMREAYPEAKIIIAGDNDKSGVGQKAASEAALAVDGQISIPEFSIEEVGSDWNDYWLNRLSEEAA